MSEEQKWLESIMSSRFEDEFQRMQETAGLSSSIQMTAGLLLIFSMLLLGLALLLDLPGLYYLLSGSIIMGLLLAALVTATVVHLWPRTTSFPDYAAAAARLRQTDCQTDQFEEYMDIQDGALSLLRKDLTRNRAVLMAALICLYAAVACIVAAFIVGICLWY